MYNITDTFDCVHTNIINDIYYDKGFISFCNWW